MNYPHQKIYKAKILPATNNKGTRVKITNVETGIFKIEPYRYEFSNLKELVSYYIEERYTTLPVMNYFYDQETLYLICY